MTADAFGSLLEQAEELHRKEYVLAAGILCRAALEEHLRLLCDKQALLPTGRTTINDLNQALYKGGHITKIEMKTIDTLAASGNQCAHNLEPALTSSDVKKLISDTYDLFARIPLA